MSAAIPDSLPLWQLTVGQYRELMREVQPATTAEPDGKPSKRLLSLRDVGAVYGVGRMQAKADIAKGRIKVVERRCRGGRLGTFVTIEECERVYAGARK